jgi:hypothetical protein
MRYKFWNVVRDINGTVVSGATIVVYLNGTTDLATIYDNEESGSVITSMTSDINGYFEFWVDEDDYDTTQKFTLLITASGDQVGSYSDITIVPNNKYLVHPVTIEGLPIYGNNGDAIWGGLTVGQLYRTGGNPDYVCVVH